MTVLQPCTGGWCRLRRFYEPESKFRPSLVDLNEIEVGLRWDVKCSLGGFLATSLFGGTGCICLNCSGCGHHRLCSTYGKIDGGFA